MKPEKVEKITAALSKKGFVERKKGHHRYFIYSPDGEETDIYTYFSHGSTECSPGILSSMKKQLGLTQEQLRDLIECPLSKEQLEKIYRDGNRI